jgi:hypothetical protein
MKIRIANTEVQELLSGKSYDFPKYTTQIMNLANQNAQGTRPKNVGQMSDLIQDFEGKTLEEWAKWYLEKHPNSIESATEKVFGMITNLQNAAAQINKAMVRDWIEELVIIKTFSGLKFQEAILKKLSLHFNTTYRLAKPKEESLGIDGFIGTKAISIKPLTYQTKQGLNETIDIPIIYYDKKKSQIVIEFDEELFQ